MKVKSLVPNKQYRRLRREYNLTGLHTDIMSIKEDSSRYDTCLVYQMPPEQLAQYEPKIQAQRKRDKANMSLAYSRICAL